MAAMTEQRITVTFFADHAAKQKRQEFLTIEELAALARDTTAPTKDQLPWWKLARFGNAVTRHGSLRHDQNVLAISGVEADYDGERVSFSEAVEIAEKAGLKAILYTSPSHSLARPRWRVLAPTSREYPPKDRARLLGRLNGLYRGIFAKESWSVSQSYFFGRVAANPAHQVEPVDGQPIDLLDELDTIWLGKHATPTVVADLGESSEAREDAELVRRIVSGDGFHVELAALAARHIGRSMAARDVATILRGLMLAHPDGARDQRWHDRFREIGTIVTSAARKFVPEAERRRAIARLTHELVRRGRSGPEIQPAVLAEAQRINLAPDAALDIARGILRDIMEGRRNG
jgi:hypothetical protein